MRKVEVITKTMREDMSLLECMGIFYIKGKPPRVRIKNDLKGSIYNKKLFLMSDNEVKLFMDDVLDNGQFAEVDYLTGNITIFENEKRIS